MPKKAKTSKAPKNSKGSGIDSITGTKWNLDGVALESDRVYSGTQIQQLFGFKEIPGVQDYDGWSTEVEFGDPKLIVQTIKYTQNDSTGESWQTTQRFVWEGEFRYSSKGMTSAKLNRLSDDLFSVRSDGLTIKTGSISNPLSGSTGITIENPGTLASWGSVITPIASVPYDQQIRESKYQNTIDTPSTETHTSNSTFDGNEAGIRGYMSGRFFADGWWNNPFTPNLI